MDPNVALFANDAFYVAFAAGDADAMDRLWARTHAVSCIHPGWPALLGRDAVMDSWRRILANPDAPAVRMHNARAVLVERLANVICYESIGSQTLVATNIFLLEDGEARLVHHQAGPCADPPEPETNAIQ
ncbi:MAG: nuclear transport factor 2 family protein [Pseudomonadales bacterium]|nr:nuclear transport factor 2 family protein [Pseudomonadales bacterium]